MTDTTLASAASELRRSWATWTAAGLLPLPLLSFVESADHAVIACVYLGLASAWMAAEFFRAGGPPASRTAWAAKTAALSAAVTANVAVFILMGLAAGVRTKLPFPLMAALSAVPAIGLVPWLVLRLRQPYGALLAAALLLLAAKLAACVAAIVYYGPGAQAAGRIAGDWDTASLMISLFWGQAAGLSVAGLAMGARLARRREHAGCGAGEGNDPAAPISCQRDERCGRAVSR